MSPATSRTARKWIRRTAIAAGLAAGVFVLAMAVIACLGLCDHLGGEPDVGLVLGNTVEPDGRPSARLQGRLDEALFLYRQGYFGWVIVSGGVDRDGHDEGAVMRGYLVDRGVPQERVIRDSAGINTYESARHTVQIMREHGWNNVCVVTQFYHIPRARLALKRFGARDISNAHARFFEAGDFYATGREVAGYVKYALRHYDFIPGHSHPGRKPQPDIATR